MHRDFTRLTDPPLHALPLPQQQLEKLLDEHACELGADIRRGHQVIGLSQDDAAVTVSELQNSVHRVLGVRLPVREATRLSRFTFKARQADSYRQGRILLAGDAAHLFPAAGVALNAGLLDAVNLAWKLAADLHGGAPAGLLDTYHGERHLAGARTMLHTRAQVALRRGHDEAAEALRQLFQELLADEEPLRRMGALVAGAGIRRAAD
ncbi:FAD-dependent monooxygenase [Micromonospora sp. NBC_00330]|uniref:FAD-dependent monooxygenase n=1 Tax=Micromonospora sp. NBC_00330 TaxID=2903585 RepID=UPI002E2CE793|nr:FAD-dependent monooxygenase [Micromonospora sp. NBC_00330]